MNKNNYADQMERTRKNLDHYDERSTAWFVAGAMASKSSKLTHKIIYRLAPIMIRFYDWKFNRCMDERNDLMKARFYG